MTVITYETTTLPPLEMWVEGRTARDYPDFDIIDYDPPPKGLIGCFSGRANIRKRGGPTVHRWSPQLVALNTTVIKAIERNTPLMFSPGLKGRRRKASKDFDEGHHRLYSGDLDYHGTLIQPCDGESLEDVQARIVAALWVLTSSSSSKEGRATWMTILSAVKSWTYQHSSEAKPGE